MTLAFWCIFAAALLHMVSKFPVAKAQVEAGGYDNNQPRSQQALLTGWGQRACAAHQNQIEAFSLFAAGVLVATVGNANQHTIDLLACGWVVARLLYLGLYLADQATMRSVVWGIGFTLNMALITSPAWAGS